MIHSLGHVGLGVSNLQQSLEFYRDLIGMEVVMEIDASDDRIGRVIGIPNAKCHIVHLKLGDAVLELFEYYYPTGQNKAKTMRQCDHGLIHIGFEVTDFHKHIEQLKKNNVKFLGEPVEFRPGVWIVYFQGPDGEVCELKQIE